MRPFDQASTCCNRMARSLIAQRLASSRAACRTRRYSLPSLHHGDEGCRVTLVDRAAQAIDRSLQGVQRFHAVVVQALDLEIQVGVLGRDASRDVELRVERRARHAREPWRGFTALGERREERDVERMREAEHESNETVVLVESHHDEIGHRRTEQGARFRERRRIAEVDEDHVPARQQLGVRTEHRVHRRHVAAGGTELLESRAQRRLQRTDVEHDAARPPRGQFRQHFVRDPDRRGHDDEVVMQVGRLPVGDAVVTRHLARRIGHRDRKALRGEEIRHPAPHLAACRR